MTREDWEEHAGDDLLFLGDETGEFDCAIMGLSAHDFLEVLRSVPVRIWVSNTEK